MKQFIRKVSAVGASVAMLGMTAGGAVAADLSELPAPFVADGSYVSTAIVVGAQGDDAAAQSTLKGYFDGFLTEGEAVGEVLDSETELKVPMGGLIDFVGSDIDSNLTDSNLNTLFDKKISWDDGGASGSDDYDIHEVIQIGAMNILTSYDDEELTGVAMSNDMGVEYRYVFDDALNTSGIGATGADTLYLTILGEKYEVSAISANTLTVVTSEETTLGIGGVFTFDEKTFTVEDIFENGVLINGETIDEGSSEEIDGVQIQLDTAIYHSFTPETSKAILKYGEDISKTYTNGDEYIGEDEDDPLWVWTISDPSSVGGYIGVKYNVNINDADDEEAGDSIKYVGDSYVLPENFAEVKLDGLTDVEYEDITVEFVEQDLYNSSDGSSANENAQVIKVSAGTTSSITLDLEETDTMYIWYANSSSGTEANAGNGSLEYFYRDHEGDNTPTNKARYESKDDMVGVGNLSKTNVSTIEVGDTVINLAVTVSSGVLTVHFDNPEGEGVDLNIGGTALNASAGTLERLGATAEGADADDIKVKGTDVSTKDGSIMDYYGVIVADADSSGVEGNADADKVVLSVPDERVYAEVSVNTLSGVTTTTSEAALLDDTESNAGYSNLILVGGPCVNSVTASFLGFEGNVCGADSNIGENTALLKLVEDAGQTALIVAGWEKADTQRGATAVAEGGLSGGDLLV